MIVIGELINSTRDEVKQALADHDEATIRRLAREQVAAGADILDVNTATSRKREIEDMEWVIDLIHDEVGTDVRLAIDSPNTEAVKRGLEKAEARPMVNSVNNEPSSQEALVPLLREHDADVIGLTMGGAGMPKALDDRLQEAEQLVNSLDNAGFDLSRLYIDPLVMTIGSNQEQAGYVIETVRAIQERWGEQGVKTSVGLSNVSYGLPHRGIINRAFLAMLLEAGLGAAIIDPTERPMMDTLRASEALLGIDAHCLGYIKYMRARESN